MDIKYTEHENLIIYTFMNFLWMWEMHSLKFVESETYAALLFNDKYVQDSISKTGIFNQGMIPIAFYILLVIPNETILKKYKKHYDAIDVFISENINPDTNSTYRIDNEQVRYLFHFRNAVSHLNLKMTKDEGFITIGDKDPKTNAKFNCKFSYKDLGLIIEKLIEIHHLYISDVKLKYSSKK